MSGDYAILRDACDRLEATGAFDAVILGAEPDRARVGADRTTAAWLKRERATERPLPGDADRERTLTVSLWLAAKGSGADLEQRDAHLDQLEAIARNALDGQSLAGLTMPSRTKLGESQPDRSGSGEARLKITGVIHYRRPQA